MSGEANAASKAERAPEFGDRVAVIADACGESGNGIARYLSSRGATVALCGADRKALDGHAGQIVALGGRAIVAEAAGSDAIPGVVERLQKELGRIDILVNNPGEAPAHSLAELSIGDFKNNLDSMLTTAFAFLHEVVPGMRARKFGRIINIYGLSYLGLPAETNIAAAQAGIFGLTRSVALETACDCVTVNSVVTGDIATTSLPATDAEKLAGRVPVKRLGTVADLARAIGFFASASNAYVTGQTLFVCGGKSAYFSMSA